MVSRRRYSWPACGIGVLRHWFQALRRVCTAWWQSSFHQAFPGRRRVMRWRAACPAASSVSWRACVASPIGRVERFGVLFRAAWNFGQAAAVNFHMGKQPRWGLGAVCGKEAMMGRWSLPMYGPVVKTGVSRAASPRYRSRTEAAPVWGSYLVARPGVLRRHRCGEVWSAQ